MQQNITRYEPFWFSNAKTNKLNVSTSKLKSFLTDVGFGLYKSADSRLLDSKLFLNDDGVLRVHNHRSVNRFVRKFIENIDESQFNIVFQADDKEEFFRKEVLAMWQNYSFGKENDKILTDLDLYSDEDFEDIDYDLPMFKDSYDDAHILFKNGVVRITKDKIELLPIDTIKDEGAVWESEIRNHNIVVKDKDEKDDGLFAKFFNLAMMRQNTDIKDAQDWTEEYELTDSAKEELTSLRTAYGYMIHDFNTEDESKLVFFIDSMSEMGRAEGGNGKSLVMDSIKYWKKMCTQSGKKMGGSPTQFQFSNVDLDTRFIGIDDITLDFQFDSLFNMISGDMEIERKNVDKFVIESKKKPKMGITSNYVLAGTDTSDTRRQHIVEFGSYWNRLNQEGEKVSDKRHLGGLLFSPTMSNKEWNKFYN